MGNNRFGEIVCYVSKILFWVRSSKAILARLWFQFSTYFIPFQLTMSLYPEHWKKLAELLKIREPMIDF